MPDAPQTRPRRWFRRLLLAAGTAAALFAVAGWFAAHHLEALTRFALQQVLPGISVEMGSLRAASLSRIEVRQLTLRSRKTHATLLTLAGGSINFRLGDLWRARIEEVRLDTANLIISPELSDALGLAATQSDAETARSGGGFLPWSIGRLILDGGHLRITRFGKQSPTLDLDITAHLEEVGFTGEAAHREHAIALTNLHATDTAGATIFRTGSVDLRFTPEELFAGRHLRRAHIAPGEATLGPTILNLFQPRPAKPATATSPAKPARPGWTIGRLNLDDLALTVPDAPGPIGRVSLQVRADLQNLGGTAGSDEQTLRLEKLQVAADADPTQPLLTADAATLHFTTDGLAARRLGRLEIESPAVTLTLPRPAAAAPSAPATSSPATPAASLPDWRLDRLTTRYGTLRVTGLGDGTLSVSTKFAFDLPDVALTGKAADQPQELSFWDTRAEPANAAAFLTLNVGTITFRPADVLLRQKIETVRVKGGRLAVGSALQKLLPADSPAPSAKSSPSPTPPAGGWTIGTLEIAGVRTRLEDKRPGLTELRFTVGTTLRNVRTGNLADELLEEEQTVELSNIDLRSPLNPAAKILSLRSVFVRFSLRDLARKHLREIVLLRPSIYLSQDLFVYMERATAGDPAATGGTAATPTAPAGKGWSVQHLDVKFGRLVIGSGGGNDVGLPLEFETTADNLALDNLATLQLKAALRIPRQSYEFPDYQLEVTDVEGDLRFAYPPEKGEKNLVQKLDIQAVRWRQYRARDAWLAVTFDARGINGEFGGAAYRGYVNGGFSFFFQDSSPWIGWVAGTDVDTEALTAVISPQNFSLTGPADFEIQLDAFRKRIARMRGVFQLKESGRLRIGKLDDLLTNIPPGWNLLKQSSTRIALETLRDFPYTKAAGDFWFVESQGLLNLDLSGPTGSRTFEVALHDGADAPNLWQQGKLGIK